MKRILSISVITFLSFNLFATKFELKLVNKSQQNIELYYRVIDDFKKEEPRFIFNLDSSSSKSCFINIKRNEKVKIYGYGGSVETLPVIREYKDFNKSIATEIELVLPKLEKLNILDINEVMMKLGNDNVLDVLLDSSQYVIDKMPPLGAFVFYNAKSDKILPLKPTFWKNNDEVRTFDNKYYDIIDHVSSANSAGLKVSGIPFLNKLGASFQNSNLLELIWDVDNAHFEQWQPSDKSVFQIIEDNRNSGFVNACITEMYSDSLAGGDYQLFFISSIYSADRIKVSAKKYNTIEINAEVNFGPPVSPNVEVVKPIEGGANYGYLKEKLYQNVDSTLNVSLKVLANDYTSALNTQINAITKKVQKENAERNAYDLRIEIINQFNALRIIDSTFINIEDIEVVIPIIEIAPFKNLHPQQFDTAQVDVTPIEIRNENSRLSQYNSILKIAKEKIIKYKDTLISIQILSQPLSSFTFVQSTTTAPLDKKVLNAYLRNEQ